MNVPAPHDDLAKVMRDALLPQRFPVRRDVELGACASSADGTVSFYDTVWLDQQTLAVAAVRLSRGGIAGALGAASFRQLLRAALAVLGTPQAALSACTENMPGAHFDAAVIRLDTVTGALESAVTGAAQVAVVAGGCGATELSPGEILWLAAGGAPPPVTDEVPLDGLDGLVRAAVERAGGGSAAALLCKARSRPAKSSTFAVTNDAGAIPDVLAQFETFCARQGIAAEDVEGIDVAIDEILSNIIAYAFKDGHAHEILVTAKAEAQHLVIEISDDGAPFDPLTLPPPDLSDDIETRQVGGLGMHFVRSLLDDVAYQRLNGWNVLTLGKSLGEEARHREGTS